MQLCRCCCCCATTNKSSRNSDLSHDCLLLPHCAQLSDLASRLAELKRREAKLEAHLSEVTHVKISCNGALNELSRRQEEAGAATATSVEDDEAASSASTTLDCAKLESAREAVARATEMQDRVAAQLIQLREERRRLGDKLWDLDNEVSF